MVGSIILNQSGISYSEDDGAWFADEVTKMAKNSKYQNDKMPLDVNCDIRDLNKYSKSYLNHLIKSNEMMASMLISLHNIYFYQQFMREIQKNIKNGTFRSFYKKYINLFD